MDKGEGRNREIRRKQPWRVRARHRECGKRSTQEKRDRAERDFGVLMSRTGDGVPIKASKRESRKRPAEEHIRCVGEAGG